VITRAFLEPSVRLGLFVDKLQGLSEIKDMHRP